MNDVSSVNHSLTRTGLFLFHRHCFGPVSVSVCEFLLPSLSFLADPSESRVFSFFSLLVQRSTFTRLEPCPCVRVLDAFHLRRPVPPLRAGGRLPTDRPASVSRIRRWHRHAVVRKLRTQVGAAPTKHAAKMKKNKKKKSFCFIFSFLSFRGAKKSLLSFYCVETE